MLIDSPRLTPQDRLAWEQREHFDHQIAAKTNWGEKVGRAHKVIREFAAAGPCYVSTSWGKDSTVVAHLAATSGLKLPLVWVRVKKWENPDCPTVRDAFLAEYGDLVDYHEYEVEATAARWWEEGADTQPATKRTSRGGFRLAEKDHGARHISGIRGEESEDRARAQAIWGDAGPNACRPIGTWNARDVFAYLHRYKLPVHPAYAMTHGGYMDRCWLRVSSLGGIRGSENGRAEWEAAYYPDIINQKDQP